MSDRARYWRPGNVLVAVMFAPVLLVCLAATLGRKRLRDPELRQRTLICCLLAMPSMIGVSAYLTLRSFDFSPFWLWSAAILFAAQSLITFIPLALGFAMDGSVSAVPQPPGYVAAAVDPGTGEVKVRRFVAADDRGERLTPMVIQGRIFQFVYSRYLGVGQAMVLVNA